MTDCQRTRSIVVVTTTSVKKRQMYTKLFIKSYRKYLKHRICEEKTELAPLATSITTRKFF